MWNHNSRELRQFHAILANLLEENILFTQSWPSGHLSFPAEATVVSLRVTGAAEV